MKSKKILTMVAVGMVATMLFGCGKSEKKAGNDWDSSMDITIVSREEGSGTRGAFVELLEIEEEVDGEKVDMTTQEAQITNNTSVMLTTVANDEYALGYVSLGSLDDSVKPLKVDGQEATAENIKAGNYKVARPFNIATKKDLKNEVVTDFIAYILSEEGQAVIAENGYISNDDAEEYTSAEPTGKAVVGGSSSVAPVMQKLIEAYKEVNGNAEIELQSSDSSTGMSLAADGSYDIGMASRALKESELEFGLEPQVIATDGIVVIVNKNNPNDALESTEIKDIFKGNKLVWDDIN